MKVFCDKGAERKFRQEERRAARKVAVGGQRVLEMYHQCQVRGINFNCKLLFCTIHCPYKMDGWRIFLKRPVDLLHRRLACLNSKVNDNFFGKKRPLQIILSVSPSYGSSLGLLSLVDQHYNKTHSWRLLYQERSEFYSMVDLSREPVLYRPSPSSSTPPLPMAANLNNHISNTGRLFMSVLKRFLSHKMLSFRTHFV